MALWVLRDGKKEVLIKESDFQWHIHGPEKYQWKEKVMAFACFHQWYSCGWRKKKEYEHRGLLSSQFTAFLPWSWVPLLLKPKLISGSLYSSIGDPAIFDCWTPNRARIMPYFRDFFFLLWTWNTLWEVIVRIHTYSTTSEKRKELRGLSMRLKRATCGLESLKKVIPLLSHALWCWDEKRLQSSSASFLFFSLTWSLLPAPPEE